MKAIALRIVMVSILGCVWPAFAARPNVVFQIGAHDADYHEFAIAGNYENYCKQFPADVDYVVGQSQAKRDWPYVLPGPDDTWAKHRKHPFKIHFRLSEKDVRDSRLTIDFIATQGGAPPLLQIDINGASMECQLPSGKTDRALENPKEGNKYTLKRIIPAGLLNAGDNVITLVSLSGSWALFDDLRLETGVSHAAKFLTIKAEALPFFKNSANGLLRAIKLSIENSKSRSEHATLSWTAGTSSESQEIDLHFGWNEKWICVPDSTAAQLTLKTATIQTNIAVDLPPARKWQIFIVPTTHTDIGYTDLQSNVEARHAENGLKVLDWLAQNPSFKWYSETYWQLDALLRLHPEKTDEVMERLRQQRWGLSGDFANMLTGLCSGEALDRLILDSHNLANRGGFELNSVVLDDVPSAVGSVPMVLAHSGVKYFIEGVNHDRAPYATSGLPAPFYWEGPDGSRVLAHIAGGYGMGLQFFSSMARASEKLPPFLAQHETADYPYDAVLVNGAFSDNRAVQPELLDVVRQWNEQWAYPKVTFAQPEDFFHYIEKNATRPIPVLKTDFGGWWEDGAASSALETTLSRRAEERAVTAEMLHSLAGILAGAAYPKTNFDGLWHNILLYNEHTWGAAGSIHQPDDFQTVQQWEVKASFARDADEESKDLLASGMRKLAGLAPPADLVVFNQLAWSRNAIVKIDIGSAVKDLATQQVAPCQALPEGGSCFVARDLPSIGYKCFRQAALTETPGDAVTVSANAIENEYYRVTVNPKTGAIHSIYDKQDKRELVDVKSDYNLGELVYVTGGENTYAIHSDLRGLPPPTFKYLPQIGTDAQAASGPVFGELTCHATAKNFPGITMRIRLYRDLKQLDLVYELDKTETTNKEAVYLAFPFAVDAERGGLWLEYPDEVTQPAMNQHSSACRDWYSVQRWLAVSDGSETVELSPLDTPMVTLGQMTASTWPRKIPFHRGHVFAYVMNNYWHTNYKAKQGGRFVFHFSITSENGPFSKHRAVVDGWNMYCPPPASRGQTNGQPNGASFARSLVEVTPQGLPLTTIKEAENANGFVFRLSDLAGDAGTAAVAIPAIAREADECNLVETPEKKLADNIQNISVPLKPFSPATVVVQFGR